MQIGTDMNIRAIILSSILLLAMPVFAREKTDVIVMKNGDRLTGEIKWIDAGVLYISLDYVDGTISVQWSKVARLESSQQFIVKTQEGSVYSGPIKTVETPSAGTVKVQVADSSEKEVVLDWSRIVELDQTSENFWRRLNGAINFGTIFSKGNQSAQYNLSSQAEYLRERWSAQTNLSSNLSSSTGTNASTRNQVGLGVRRLLPWENYFYSGLGSFLQSSEQGINLQTNVGGGIGRYLKNTNRESISVLVGMAWQNTDYKPSIVPLARQNIAAAMIAADLRVFRFKKTNLRLNAMVFPAVSEPGRVFFDTNGTYYIKLFNNLSWNLSFYGNWDTRPPANFSGSDYGSSSGLSWTFGNR
jgi:hypothetical protein